MSHFFPKMSSFVAKLVDQVLILIFDGQFVNPVTSHMAKYVYAFMLYSQLLPYLFRYTCEFNIAQYGEYSMPDLAKYSEQERRESVKDIFSLGLVAHLESVTTPNLPGSQEVAKKAAVNIVLPYMVSCYAWG